MGLDITIVHHSLSFEDAEKTMLKHPLTENIILKVVNNDYLREMKIRSHRLKDWSDVEQMDKLSKLDQNNKKE